MKYLVAVDGGGSKTESVLIDVYGNVINRKIGKSSNANDIGKVEAINTIVDIVKESLPEEFDSFDVCVGGAGILASGIGSEMEWNLSALERVDKVKVISDIQSAYYAVRDKNDAILILGTGCISFTEKNGEEIKVGGGGYFIDDLYSGYDLGKAVLNAVLEERDGRGEKTLLSKLFFDTVGSDIYSELKNIYKGGRSYVAQFAPLCFLAYDSSDAVATNIFKKSISNLEKLLWAVYRICEKEQCTVAVFGGVSKRMDLLERFLSDSVKSKVKLNPTDVPILLGTTKALWGQEGDFVNNFLQSYKKLIDKS